ncbi:hypothetical protein BTA31_04765 [Bacillus haynesii]|uniref:Uncharacterized protein n=1 Tax=Bacillus haynesii TaxID=1925021 RepID=A0ABX3I666_9BACI|nr:hypothetical protein BTA31_04765 [Bacillus haynesii]
MTIFSLFYKIFGREFFDLGFISVNKMIHFRDRIYSLILFRIEGYAEWLDEENWFITDRTKLKKELSFLLFMKMAQLTGDGDRNSLV